MVAEKFTSIEGKYVPIEEITVRGFKEILEGKHDHIAERHLNAGSIEDVTKA